MISTLCKQGSIFVVLAMWQQVLSVVNAAPIVTMTATPVTRTQNGTNYVALDFFYTNSPSAQFLNYRLTVSTTNGAKIDDPARAQRDRQYDSANEAANSGNVDTYMNTVWSYASKESDGNTASYVFNTYNPSGAGTPSPPLSLIDWSVFDTMMGDFNDLGPTYPVSAPYRLARVLVLTNAIGTASFLVYDTATVGTGTVFQFTITPEPATLTLLSLAMGGALSVFRRR
jgi:hypothetical protein